MTFHTTQAALPTLMWNKQPANVMAMSSGLDRLHDGCHVENYASPPKIKIKCLATFL